MTEIIINAANNTSRTVLADEINAEGKATTLADVLRMEDVLVFFGVDPTNADEADAVINHVIAIDDTELPGAFRAAVLGSAAANNQVVDIDLDGRVEENEVDDEESDEEEDEEEGADEDTGSDRGEIGSQGTVTVFTSGGLQATNIQIVVGTTSVRSAIFNDSVRARSGMTDTMLSNCDVLVNDEPVCATRLGDVKCWNGDSIVLSIRTAHSKGC